MTVVDLHTVSQFLVVNLVDLIDDHLAFDAKNVEPTTNMQIAVHRNERTIDPIKNRRNMGYNTCGATCGRFKRNTKFASREATLIGVSVKPINEEEMVFAEAI